MNFLGREKAEAEPEPVVIGGHGGSREGPTVGQEGARTEQAEGVYGSNEQGDKTDDIFEATDERRKPNTYAGVVVFCVPIAAETGRGGIDFNTLQVWE